MARIRIVDEWLRSPASTPTHARAVMVVAEKWAEQRVLMRAYADSRDQTRPTIVLHGVELAIGPASLDAHGSWGIHVPAASPGQTHDDGTAQALCAQLELAAKRLAGARGSPARLADEEPTFERDITNNWAPGTARAVPGTRPASMTRLPAAQLATLVPMALPAEVVAASAVPATPVVRAKASTSSSLRKTPVPRAGGRARTPSTGTAPHARTALGYQSGAGAQSALVRLGLTPAVSARLGRLGSRTVSVDFQISRAERTVINALGERPLSARDVGTLTGVADPVGWMEQLTTKLERFGLDLIEPGEPRGGEPTYVLRT